MLLTSLKAEIRKVLTVRSTYVFLLMITGLIGLFGFYAQGLSATQADLDQSNFIEQMITNSVGFVATIGALIVLLLITHEYRYNTIMHTLTASNSRARSLLAKLIVSSVLAVILTLVFCALAPLLSMLGSSLVGRELGPQTLYFKDLIWQCVFTGWAIMMVGFIIAAIVRNQIGAIVLFFLLPSTIEGLLSFVFRGNSKYLPFSAISSVSVHVPSLSPGKAALISMLYIAVGLGVSFALFIRRDAN